MSHMLATLVLSILLIGPSLAQHGHGSGSPYAGLERRAVKALSSDEIADLRAGRGMGLALAAELNGYPGPVHVLEHAGSLALSGEQRARMQTLYEAMRAEAISARRAADRRGNASRSALRRAHRHRRQPGACHGRDRGHASSAAASPSQIPSRHHGRAHARADRALWRAARLCGRSRRASPGRTGKALTRLASARNHGVKRAGRRATAPWR